MGKRIIQQRRGKGSLTYQVRKKSFSVKPAYTRDMEGEYAIVKIFANAGHTCPIVKLKGKKGKITLGFAAKGVYEGQKIKFGGNGIGDINYLGELKNGTEIFNIENIPNDGGRFVRAGGNSAVVSGRKGNLVLITLPSKKVKAFNPRCRATIGETAGQGRLDKPVLKAGKKFFIKKAKSKLWPRTSAVAMNAIDHPFGSGRGKRIKSKIIPRMASPGQKVGLLRPRRTGKRK
jgi:large subunit ribosomal protein L2